MEQIRTTYLVSFELPYDYGHVVKGPISAGDSCEGLPPSLLLGADSRDLQIPSADPALTETPSFCIFELERVGMMTLALDDTNSSGVPL